MRGSVKEHSKRDYAETYLLKGSLIIASALLWYCIGRAQFNWFTSAKFAPGIDLVYLPAGIRLGIVLIARVWGASGITIANTLLFADEFGSGSMGEAITNSAIAGFGPLLAVWVGCRILRIDINLGELKPWHLPVLALIVSVITPILFNIHFLVYGLKPFDQFAANICAMMLGDFLGCLAVLVAMKILIAAYKFITHTT